MIDTNQVIQAGQVAQEIKTQVSPWMPALAIAAGWAGRELNRFCSSARTGAEWLMGHGGVLKLLWKLIWN